MAPPRAVATAPITGEAGTEPSGARRRRARSCCLAALATGLVLLAVALGLILNLAAAHYVPGNSDAATVVLEGQSLANGNLALSGWSLSLDSFWSVDAPFYMVGVLLLGVREVLVSLVPAGIATCAILVAALLAATAGSRRAAAATGAVVVLGFLALPSPALAFFLLQGPWHVATALYCLVAFAGIASRRRLGLVVAALAFAAGILGDFQMLALGVAPAVLAGFVTMARARSWRRGIPALLAAVGGTALAAIGRLLLDAAGGFGLVDANPTARLHQVAANIGHLPARWAGLFGVGTVPIGPTTEASRIAAVHVVGLGFVIVAVLGALATMVRASARPRRHATAATPGTVAPVNDANPGRAARGLAGSQLDDLLAIGVVADLVTFVIVSGTGNGDYARYLTAGALFAVVLAGRLAARIADRPRARRPFAIAAAAFLVLSVIGFALDLGSRAVTRPYLQLASFLQDHGLRSGVGDYWSASIVTVDSGDKVVIRPVIATPSGRLDRYGRQTTRSWYAGERFQFLVFDVAHPWRGVGAATAVATFGAPATTYVVGTYHVLVWPHLLAVSPVGYSNS